MELEDIKDTLSTVSIPKLTTQDVQHLSNPFTEEELKQAVFQIGKSKAPDLDGMPGIFLPKILENSWCYTTASVLRFLNTGHLLKEFNRTLITLVPKKTCPEEVGDYRPISLCDVIYKVGSKVMVNQMRPLLEKLITP